MPINKKDWDNLMDSAKNMNIIETFQKARLRVETHDRILVSISGGSDSDVMLDVLLRVTPKDEWNKFIFAFFDTGIEYQATKEHLDFLEKKYEINILREKSPKPVPLGCMEYGLPFLSKYASEMINRLQKHNFDFANDGWKSYDELLSKYKTGGGGLLGGLTQTKPKKESVVILILTTLNI